MSRKSFILTALVINLTICLTMCVVLFTDKDNTDKRNSEVKVITDTHNKETTNPIPIIQDNENSNIDNSNIDNSYEENFGDDRTTTYNQTSKGETEKVVESQVSSETQPKTYKKNETTNTNINTTENETTSVNIKGTTATINSSCYIRSNADVSGNMLGTANAGTTYNIDATKCTDSWIAIIMDSGQVGYVAASYCTIQ